MMELAAEHLRGLGARVELVDTGSQQVCPGTQAGLLGIRRGIGHWGDPYPLRDAWTWPSTSDTLGSCWAEQRRCIWGWECLRELLCLNRF